MQPCDWRKITLVFSLLAIVLQPVSVVGQAAGQDAPVVALRRSEVSTMVRQATLVARARVLQFTPSTYDTATHIQTAETSSLQVLRIFRGRTTGERIDVQCVCSGKTVSSGFKPGDEVIVFLRRVRGTKIWEPIGPDFEEPRTKWLEDQILREEKRP